MTFRSSLHQALRNMREMARVHFIAMLSMSTAFLCLGAALIAMTNLAAASQRWNQSARMTVYLKDAASLQDIEQLRLLLEGLPEFKQVRYISAEQAKAEFVRRSASNGAGDYLPADFFPHSLEAKVTTTVSEARIAQITTRLKNINMVDDVETYRGWFKRLQSLIATGRFASLIIAMVVLICVIVIVAGTIRLTLTHRMVEIEVLKLCGATYNFIRAPFVLEGALSGLVASGIALATLAVGYFMVRDNFDPMFSLLAGVKTVFLTPSSVLLLLVSGASVGAFASLWSVRALLKN